jgi:hypothetical protein
MSVGAVYVVLAAGTSLALFACMGIYAVRLGWDMMAVLEIVAFSMIPGNCTIIWITKHENI